MSSLHLSCSKALSPLQFNAFPPLSLPLVFGQNVVNLCFWQVLKFCALESRGFYFLTSRRALSQDRRHQLKKTKGDFRSSNKLLWIGMCTLTGLLLSEFVVIHLWNGTAYFSVSWYSLGNRQDYPPLQGSWQPHGVSPRRSRPHLHPLLAPPQPLQRPPRPRPLLHGKLPSNSVSNSSNFTHFKYSHLCTR